MFKVRVLYALLIVFLTWGCAAPPPEPTPTPTPKPASCEEVEDPCIEIVFTEDKCTYQGPSALSSGTAYLQFYNQRENRARMGLW